MRSKTAYSTFCSGMWRIFKAQSEDRSAEGYEKWWGTLLGQIYKEKGASILVKDKPKLIAPEVDPELLWAELACLFLWKFRPLEHYFLDAGLSEFLVSSVKEFSPDFCRKLPCADRSPDELPDVNSWEIGVCAADRCGRVLSPGPVGFALHFPVKERHRSVVVFPDSAMLDPTIMGVRGWFFSASDGVDIANMQMTSGTMGDCNWMLRLIFGFSLYIEAFPEVVMPTGADSTFQIGHYRGTHLSVATSDVARRENESAAVSPHFRRGHFRVLHSERFTKKRGQVVFVKGCFVKGKAYDVLSDAPPIEQKEAA